MKSSHLKISVFTVLFTSAFSCLAVAADVSYTTPAKPVVVAPVVATPSVPAVAAVKAPVVQPVPAASAAAVPQTKPATPAPVAVVPVVAAQPQPTAPKDPCEAYKVSVDAYTVCQDRITKIQRMIDARTERANNAQAQAAAAAKETAGGAAKKSENPDASERSSERQ